MIIRIYHDNFCIFLIIDIITKIKMFAFFGKFLDWIKSKFFNKELEIAIVGLQNAGKTTLVKAITDGVFEEDTIPTIGFNRHEVKKGMV